MQRACRWSRTHACSFDLGKFQLVHYTRNPRRYDPLPLVTAAHTIPASDSAKYLGLVMDRQRECTHCVTVRSSTTCSLHSQRSATSKRSTPLH
ncbi:hypothetical protein C8F04DRAFT_1107284 [Mycena alexandri]|uniref:Uncharacterized protein n=1 Tax=Mycena alexandri TaxID=1745969 RepID=A0AAD6SUD3_9AGAR|nr:hypothetical protein C8F04DRAFT_1107284 [Mycena alexandri]